LIEKSFEIKAIIPGNPMLSQIKEIRFVELKEQTNRFYRKMIYYQYIIKTS